MEIIREYPIFMASYLLYFVMSLVLVIVYYTFTIDTILLWNPLITPIFLTPITFIYLIFLINAIFVDRTAWKFYVTIIMILLVTPIVQGLYISCLSFINLLN